MKLDDWNYPGIKSACQDRCEGDPPCYEMGTRGGHQNKPCGECLRDVGIEPGDEFDQDAAVRPLL